MFIQIFLFIIGGILGIAIVKVLFLTPLEEIGFRLFWNGLFQGRIMDLEMVFKSTTFFKCLVGFIAGGLVALFITNYINKQNIETPEK